MLVIRLQRTGRKNEATYRVVLTEKSAPIKSGEREVLGHYLPTRKDPVFECNQERVKYWVGHGAIPSSTIARLLVRQGMKEMEKYVERYAKQKPKKEVTVDAPVQKESNESKETEESKDAPVAEDAPQEKKKDDVLAAKQEKPDKKEPATEQKSADTPAEEDKPKETAGDQPAEEKSPNEGEKGDTEASDGKENDDTKEKEA